MSDLKIASDLYIVIINNTKTVAQHLEENKWRICGSMVNYQNTDVDVIKHLDLANEPTTSNENALNIDLVSCLFPAYKVEEAYDDGHYDGQIQRSKTFDIETYS
tara:strand:+ start:72 stop:383 length:312 start_codon:yes stop_codon:yes gene_type:complete